MTDRPGKAVSRESLYDYILHSPIGQDWHFFRYHFELVAQGMFHSFAESIIVACLDCEKALPGFAHRAIDRLAALHGRERYQPHYEQLMQQLAELLILRRLVTFDWGGPTQFAYEPSGRTGRRPELLVMTPDLWVAVEVKCPALIGHRRARIQSRTQLVVRDLFDVKVAKGQGWSLPRDNPIKDFLVSAQSKFADVDEPSVDLERILVVVWDQHTHEVIGPLIHPMMGLLTDNSFARTRDGTALRFPSVDGVVVTGHLAQLTYLAGLGPWDAPTRDALAYGDPGDWYYNVQLVEVPYGRRVGSLVRSAFQIPPYEHEQPVEIIEWMSQLENPRLFDQETDPGGQGSP